MTAIEIYCAAFVARLRADVDVVDAPGLHGCVAEDRVVRLLVTDDRALGRLTTELTGTRGEVSVFEHASRCDELLRVQSAWTADRPATAMVLRDIRPVADAKPPGGLVLRSVPDDVPLHDAAAVAIASDPGITEPAETFTRFLGGLPASVRLLAAVDDAGVARATAGVGISGEYARIFFVNTDAAWRRRGIGHAMTVAALRTAASAGARRAYLTATHDGEALYRRIGFEAAGRLTRYSAD